MRETLCNVKEMVLASTVVVVVVVAVMVCGWTERHYTREAIVIDIDNLSNIVVVVDEGGFEWEFEGTDFEEGQKVRLLMDNNRTEKDLFDDRVDNATVIGNAN